LITKYDCKCGSSLIAYVKLEMVVCSCGRNIKGVTITKEEDQRIKRKDKKERLKNGK
jgi:hypothetical protein